MYSNAYLSAHDRRRSPRNRTHRRSRLLQRRRVGLLLGGLALLWAITANGLILVGDPYWLTLPAAFAAVGLAQLVLYRFDERQLPALLGNALGLCALMLWLVIDLAVRYLVGFELSLIDIIRDMAAS